MKGAMDDDSVRLYFIDEAVGPDDQLAEGWVGRVGIGTPALAELGQGIPGVANG